MTFIGFCVRCYRDREHAVFSRETPFGETVEDYICLTCEPPLFDWPANDDLFAVRKAGSSTADLSPDYDGLEHDSAQEWAGGAGWHDDGS